MPALTISAAFCRGHSRQFGVLGGRRRACARAQRELPGAPGSSWELPGNPYSRVHAGAKLFPCANVPPKIGFMQAGSRFRCRFLVLNLQAVARFTFDGTHTTHVSGRPLHKRSCNACMSAVARFSNAWKSCMFTTHVSGRPLHTRLTPTSQHIAQRSPASHARHKEFGMGLRFVIRLSCRFVATQLCTSHMLPGRFKLFSSLFSAMCSFGLCATMYILSEQFSNL